MTLLEAMIAIVVLGLTAAGFLGALQTSSRATHDAEVWAHAVAYAESAMEETKLGAVAADPLSASLPGGYKREVSAQSWVGGAHMQLVTVRITLPGGGHFILRRLQPEP